MWWMKKRLPHADAITTNNLLLQERFGGALLRGGKDTAAFDPARFDDDEARRALGLEGKFVVMFPGTAREHKGLEDVLAALDLLGERNARLVIVGGREIGREYAGELARRWPQWVHVLPPRGVDEMPATVAAAHVVAIAQRDVAVARSQFPIKLTDAMAMARPIITTPVGDIPDIVGDTAWLVPPSSPPDIAAALREIMSDPTRARERGDAARRRCVETLGLDGAARALGGVLDGLRSPPRAGA
jgi:glycosyltransferase involved in cell wall biosynthesis